MIFLFATLAVLLTTTYGQMCSTVTSFNAGLQPRVTDYKTRRELIGDAVKDLDSDFVCLQEMWFEDDMRRVLHAVKDVYPHHFSAIHTGTNKLAAEQSWWKPARSACSAVELGLLSSLFPCAVARGCVDDFKRSSHEGVECLASKCGAILRWDGIDPDCISCIMFSSASLPDVTERCHKVTGSDNRLNPPGLMILSKKPLINPVYKSFFPDHDMNVQRGVIKAEIEDIGMTGCTHLSSVFPHYWEYDLDIGSYTRQKEVEINNLTTDMGTGNHIVAGDLNAGPHVSSDDPDKNLQAEDHDNYLLIKRSGYDVDQYLNDDGRCSYCKSNPIGIDASKLLDDVLVMGNAFNTVTKRRVLDQTNPPLSDHYGIEASLCK